MADDSLFDSSEGESTPPAPKVPTGGDDQPDVAGGFSEGDVNKMLADAVKGGLEGLQPVFKNIEERLARMEESGTRESEIPEGSPLNRLVEDPEGYLAEKTRELLNREAGPLFATLASDKMEAMRREARSTFDQKFGEGAFDKHVAEDLDKILDNLPTTTKASARHFNSAIDAVVGRKFDELSSARAERDATVKRDAARMLPGSRPRPASKGLSDEEKDFMANWERNTGEKLDPKEWVRDRDMGDSLDDWLPVLQAGGRDAA